MSDSFRLAVTAIVKNEATYIEEWLCYHLTQGVEHFFIYDNNSTDDTRDVLQRYISRGLVTFVHWPTVGGQVEAYVHSAHFFGCRTEWMAFIDIDEFVVPRSTADLPSLLSELDAADQVVFPWRMIGFSGFDERPAGLVIENFTTARDIPDGGFALVLGKPIVRPASIKYIDIHCHLTHGGKTVDPSGRPVPEQPFMEGPSFDAGQVNHYYTKSYAEFAAKIARGQSDGQAEKVLFGVEEQADYRTEDTAIARFVPAVRQRMARMAELSPSPFRYGGDLAVGALRRDPLQYLALRAASNHLAGVAKISNAVAPVPHTLGRSNSVLAMRPPGGHDVSSLAESVHLRDLDRRIGATVRWELGARPTPIGAAGGHDHLVASLGNSAALLHVALVASFRATQPASVSCFLDGDEDAAVTATIDAAGEYLWIVEVNRQPRHAEQLVLRADGSGVEVTDARVVSYG